MLLSILTERIMHLIIQINPMVEMMVLAIQRTVLVVVMALVVKLLVMERVVVMALVVKVLVMDQVVVMPLAVKVLVMDQVVVMALVVKVLVMEQVVMVTRMHPITLKLMMQQILTQIIRQADNNLALKVVQIDDLIQSPIQILIIRQIWSLPVIH
jgi:hypothetical protein